MKTKSKGVSGKLSKLFIKNSYKIITIFLIFRGLFSFAQVDFVSTQTIPLSSTPWEISTGDFNNDNKADLLVRFYYNSKNAILLNDGTGNFDSAIYVNTYSFPHQTTIADFNNDGKLDFAQSHSSGTNMGNKVTVHLGNGDGTFQAYSLYTVWGNYCYTLDAGDINKDGYSDLVVTSAGYPDGFSILLNNGNGTFTNGSTYNTGQETRTIKLGDINNDGNLDVVVGCGAYGSGYQAEVFFGNGGTTFSNRTIYTSPVASAHVAVRSLVDFDGDGDRDVLVNLEYNNNYLYWMKNNGSGVFTYHLIDNDMGAWSHACDWDGDGDFDILDNRHNGTKYNQAKLYLNNGTGVFNDTIVVNTEYGWVHSPVNLNGDNYMDMASFSIDSTYIKTSIRSNPVNLDSGLVAHYPFNGNANDESGNGNHGTVYGATLTTDRFGNDSSAYSFDGVDDYIKVDHDTIFNFNTSFSISFWEKALNIGDVICKGRDITCNSFNIFSNLMKYHCPSKFVGQANILGDWQFITAIYNQGNSSLEFYINGVLDSSANFINNFTVTNQYPLVFGRHFTNADGSGGYNYQYQGSIDDIMFFDKALTQFEIDSLYHIGGWGDNGLVTSYPFNGNANDESGNGNHGTVYGATLTTDRFGNDSSAYFFNGGYIHGTIQNFPIGNNTKSISAWVKPTGIWLNPTNGSARDIFVVGNNQTSALNFRFWENDKYIACIDWTSNAAEYTLPGSYNHNKWYHAVFTYNDSLAKLYLDNNLVDTAYIDLSVNSNGTFTIGRSLIGSSFNNLFNGVIDDILIYNKELSINEIDSLYHEGGWPMQIVSVNPPTATNSSRCGPGSVALTASIASGSAVYKWYNSSTDTTVLFTGANYSTPVLTQTDTFFVAIDSSGYFSDRVMAIATVNPLPSATVTAGGATTFCQGATVILNANSGSNLNYQWKKDNSTISGATSSGYTASESGDYKVVVTDTNSCVDSSTAISVTVNPLPTATATAGGATTFCQGATVNLNANSGANLSYQWKKDNSTISGATSSGYTASESGDYKVVVTDANSCVDSSTAISVTVNPLPTATATAGGATTFCQGASVNLNASSVANVVYQWKKNGTIINGANSPTFTANQTASYYVVVTNFNNCSDSSSAISVIVNPLPAANITAGGATTFCSGSSVNLNANTGAGLNYQWRKNGSNLTGVSSSSITANQSGDYTVVITDTNGCENSSSAINIVVNSLPAVSINTVFNSQYCSNDGPVSISASPSGGIFSGSTTNSIFNPTLVSTGQQTIIYSYTDGNGCINSDTVHTTVTSAPTVSFATLPNVCQSTVFSQLSGGTPSGGIYSGNYVSQSQGYFYPQSAGIGNHQITYTYTDINGCSNSISQTQKVVSAPIADFSLSPTLCHTDTANITFTGQAGPNAAYNWNFHGGIISTGSGVGPYNIHWNSIGLAQVDLVVTDSGCVSNQVSKYTNILSGFAMITTVGTPTVCFGDSVIMFVNTGLNFQYQWYDDNGIKTNDTLSYLSANQSGNYYCKVSAPYTCPTFSDTVQVVVKPELISNFSLPISACAGDLIPVNFAGAAPVGTNYLWDFQGATVASGSGSGPYNIIWNNDSIHRVSLTLTESSCSSTVTEKDISILSPAASVSAIGNTTICNGEKVALVSNTGAYSYIWRKDSTIISGANQPFYQATQSGNYLVEVTDTLTGCSNVSNTILVTVNSTDFNLAFSANPTSFNAQPFITTFTNQTPNPANYFWKWNFGDGSNLNTQVSPLHTYSFDGNYSVELVAQNINTLCFDTLLKTNYISCNGGSSNPCNILAQITALPNKNHICPKDSIKLFVQNPDTTLNFQWLKDGVLINGATSPIYYAKQFGNYQIMISDSSCTVFSSPHNLNVFSTITPIIQSNGIITPCSNDSLELFVNTFFNDYTWSNGKHGSSIFVKRSGDYIVTVTDNNGCVTESTPFLVNASLIQAPEICGVSFDSASNHNKILWNFSSNNLTDSFRIYRETFIAGQYDLIGSQSADSPSIFVDINSTPQIQSHRYKISAIDSCGSESPRSIEHKTMHLKIYASINNYWNLSWDQYQGFNFGTYRIYRGTDSANMVLLTQLPATLNSYTDINPPTGDVYYQLEIINPNMCSYDSASSGYSSYKSNMVNTNTSPNIGMSESNSKDLSLVLFPNPNNGSFTLKIKSNHFKEKKITIEIYTVLGDLIYSEVVQIKSDFDKTMQLNQINRGIYFIHLKTDTSILNTRFIVN
ncbi:MAG: VCBS repeat-containing protein [Bacteroidales bacterium]|nr:VCBS repeat-containing protein [Bacteroidales bacterium]